MITVNVWLFGRQGKWWKIKSTLPYYSKSKWRVFHHLFQEIPRLWRNCWVLSSGLKRNLTKQLRSNHHSIVPCKRQLHCPLQAPTWFLSIVMLNWLIAGGTWHWNKKSEKKSNHISQSNQPWKCEWFAHLRKKNPQNQQLQLGPFLAPSDASAWCASVAEGECTWAI